MTSRARGPCVLFAVIVVLLLSRTPQASAQNSSVLSLPVHFYDQSPGNFGPCAADRPLITCKVDFEWALSSPLLETGIVRNILDYYLRSPVYNGRTSLNTSVHSQSTFNTWFQPSSFTKNVAGSLALSNTPQAPRTFGTLERSNFFFPMDGKGWDVPRGIDENRDLEGMTHNFHFCMETHGRFPYKGGEIFRFSGTDDFFLFINNLLVIDLGGVHPSMTREISLDAIARNTSLVVGNYYRFDMFWCNRHTRVSDFNIQSSIEATCAYYDWCGVCEGNGQTCCKPTDCQDSDPCTIDSCDTLIPPTLNCIHRLANCTAPDMCYTSSCQRPEGVCVDRPISCPDDGNKCTIESCDPTKGGCISVPKLCCDSNGVCCASLCDQDTGQCMASTSGSLCPNQPTCTSDDACSDGIKCTVDSCQSGGTCSHTTRTCVAPDKCTIATCDNSAPSSDGCVYTPLKCQNTTCVAASCDPAIGCVYTDKKQCPVPTGYCNVSACDESAGCLVMPRVCLLADLLSSPQRWQDNFTSLWKYGLGGSGRSKGEDCFTGICDPAVNKCVVHLRQPWTGYCSQTYSSSSSSSASSTSTIDVATAYYALTSTAAAAASSSTVNEGTMLSSQVPVILIMCIMMMLLMVMDILLE